jgi:hypothetical protein
MLEAEWRTTQPLRASIAASTEQSLNNFLPNTTYQQVLIRATSRTGRCSQLAEQIAFPSRSNYLPCLPATYPQIHVFLVRPDLRRVQTKGSGA